MEGLKEISIGTLAKGIRGVSYKPNQLKDDVGESDYFLLRSNNIQNGKIDFNDRQIVVSDCVSEKQKLLEDDIIVCMSNGSRHLVGKSAIVKKLDANYCVGAFCSSFRVNEGVNPNFVFQIFQSKDFKNKIDVILSGSAINNLQNKHIEELKFELPSSEPEQTRIAEILSKADAALAQTEALIAKYQRIKTGLMQDLLTKGIDEQGNIRSEQTHRFKTEKGLRVPEEWEVKTFEEATNLITDFTANGSFESLRVNVKYYYSPNYGRLIRLTDLRHDLKNDGVFVDEGGFKYLRKSELIKGDILFANVGEYTGFTCLMPEVSYKATIAPNMFLIRVKEEFENSFFYYQMNHAWFQKQVADNNLSSTTKLVNKTNLRKFFVTRPQKEEQIKIVDIIKSIDKLIEEQSKNLQKLQSLKTGLMQDLLSGKVRVAL